MQWLGPSDTLTTGDGKIVWAVPSDFNGWVIKGVHGHSPTPSTSGAITLMVRRNRAGTDVDVLSTALTLDQDDDDSKDATTAAVINTSNDDLATGDEIWIDVDGAGTGAKGTFANIKIASS